MSIGLPGEHFIAESTWEALRQEPGLHNVSLGVSPSGHMNTALFNSLTNRLIDTQKVAV